MTAERGFASSERRTQLLIAIVLAVAGAAFWLLCLATGDGREFTDSPWWVWGALLLPALAATVAFATPVIPRLWWGLLLVAPQMIAIAVLGTALHDPQQGASLWMMTEFFLVVHGLLAWGGAWFGVALRRLRQTA